MRSRERRRKNAPPPSLLLVDPPDESRRGQLAGLCGDSFPVSFVIAAMPVDTHLCQTEGASCGACCGLYNFADHGRAALTEELVRHTDALDGVASVAASWREIGERLVRERRAAPMFAMVRVCPLLGFLDGARSRVGCLAHPSRHGGTDLRDCGVYTAEVCETFTCPSFTWLTEPEARLVREACEDWYLYGLVITDVEFVRGCLTLLQRELAGPVPLERLREGRALSATRALFALKESDELRSSSRGVFGRFIDAGGEEPELRTLDYGALALVPSPEDDVALCAGAEIADPGALVAARALIRSRVRAVLDALGS